MDTTAPPHPASLTRLAAFTLLTNLGVALSQAMSWGRGTYISEEAILMLLAAWTTGWCLGCCVVLVIVAWCARHLPPARIRLMLVLIVVVVGIATAAWFEIMFNSGGPGTPTAHQWRDTVQVLLMCVAAPVLGIVIATMRWPRRRLVGADGAPR